MKNQISLTTTFAGLHLTSPIIAGSSGMTASSGRIEQLEASGAGAVILKSIFEEQIIQEAYHHLTEGSQYPEAREYMETYTQAHSLDEYISLIQETKKKVKIPIIASICCNHDGEWTHFAQVLQKAGADALELNIYILSTDTFTDADIIEQQYFDIVRHIRNEIYIPIIVKIGQNFTNLTSFVDKLRGYGADAVTLFNRFYMPDINIEQRLMTAASTLSTPSDIHNVLRWTGILRGVINEDLLHISASSGVFVGSDAIKLILAGATTVQVCSLLYRDGIDSIRHINDSIRSWMERHGFRSIEEWRGKLSYASIPNAALYERVQFMKYFENNE